MLINRNNAAVQQNINWINNGDTHTASIALDEEALYSIMANYTDMAGNTIENAYNTAFYIDKKHLRLLYQEWITKELTETM